MFYEQSCVLCLEKSRATDSQISIDSDNQQSISVRETIEQHFKEELSMTPYLKTKIVCIQCWELVQSFHAFFVRVKNAHSSASNKLKSLQELEISVADIKVEIDAIDELASPLERGQTNIGEHVESEPVALQECSINIDQLTLPIIASIKDSQQGKNVDHDIKNKEVQDERVASNFSPQLFEDESAETSSVAESIRYKDGAVRLQQKKETQSKRRPKARRTKLKSELKQRNKQRNKTSDYDEFIAQNFKLTCFLCQKSLIDFRDLKIHFREQHQTNGYVKCCGKKFLKRGVLVDHIHVHIEPEYFKCQHCERVLCDRSGLEAHLQFSHGSKERIYNCDTCSKSFFSRKVLARHYLIHAPEEQKNIKCPQCDKAFCNQYSMKQHLALVHLNLYAKICDICGKAMNGNEAFRRHQEEHAGVPMPSVKCTLCNTELKTKYGLARHMKTMHTKEYQTPQVCPICSKVSPSLRAHKSHMEYMHTTEKKHACKLCDKAFKLPRCLREHMSTHLGEVLYTCTFCPQTFNSKSNMYAHRKRKHPKEWAEKCAKKSLAL